MIPSCLVEEPCNNSIIKFMYTKFQCRHSTILAAFFPESKPSNSKFHITKMFCLRGSNDVINLGVFDKALFCTAIQQFANTDFIQSEEETGMSPDHFFLDQQSIAQLNVKYGFKEKKQTKTNFTATTEGPAFICPHFSFISWSQ